MGKVYYDSNFDKVKADIESKAKICNRMLMEEIHRTANLTTPLLNSDLRHSCIKTCEGMSGIMLWNVPYATYQERGRRYDGSHVVKHYTTPGTGPWFAKNAIKRTLMDTSIRRYWK